MHWSLHPCLSLPPGVVECLAARVVGVIATTSSVESYMPPVHV